MSLNNTYSSSSTNKTDAQCDKVQETSVSQCISSFSHLLLDLLLSKVVRAVLVMTSQNSIFNLAIEYLLCIFATKSNTYLCKHQQLVVSKNKKLQLFDVIEICADTFNFSKEVVTFNLITLTIKFAIVCPGIFYSRPSLFPSMICWSTFTSKSRIHPSIRSLSFTSPVVFHGRKIKYKFGMA